MNLKRTKKNQSLSVITDFNDPWPVRLEQMSTSIVDIYTFIILKHSSLGGKMGKIKESSSHVQNKWPVPWNVNGHLWIIINGSDGTSTATLCVPDACWDVCFREGVRDDGGEWVWREQNLEIVSKCVCVCVVGVNNELSFDGAGENPFWTWLIRFHCTPLLKAKSLGQNYTFWSVVSQKAKSASRRKSKDICLNCHSSWATTHVINCISEHNVR